MSSLFGINIPKVLRQAIKSAGGVQSGTLVKVTHGAVNASNYAAGRPRTLTNVPFEGFIDDPPLRSGGVVDAPGSQMTQGRRQVTILGDSLPAGTVPRPNDQVIFDGVTYTIAEDGVKTDPVKAVWICMVRGGAA